MTEEIPTQLVLETAISLIEEYGWIQGTNGTKETGFCIRGGIVSAARQLIDDEKEFDSAVCKAWNKVNLSLSLQQKQDHNYSVSVWNDHKGRTEEEVLELMRQAVKNAI